MTATQLLILVGIIYIAPHSPPFASKVVGLTMIIVASVFHFWSKS
jgi:hypothetical protein